MLAKLDWVKREIASFEMFNPDKKSAEFMKTIRLYVTDIIKVLEDDLITNIALDRMFKQ